MKRPVAFAPAVLADMAAIGDYIAIANPRRAESFVLELKARCRRIARHPFAYPLRQEYGPGVRMAVHGPYLIFFVPLEDCVSIERIIHGARDLGRLDED